MECTNIIRWIKKVEADRIQATLSGKKPLSGSDTCFVCLKQFFDQDELALHLANLNIKIKVFCLNCLGLFDYYKQCGHDFKGKLNFCVMCNSELPKPNPGSHICFHKGVDVGESKMHLATKETLHRGMENSTKTQLKQITNETMSKELSGEESDMYSDTSKNVLDEEEKEEEDEELSALGVVNGHLCKVCRASFPSAAKLSDHWKSLIIKTGGYCFGCKHLFERTDSCRHSLAAKLMYCSFCKANLKYYQVQHHLCFHNAGIVAKDYPTEERHFQARVMDDLKAADVETKKDKEKLSIGELLAKVSRNEIGVVGQESVVGENKTTNTKKKRKRRKRFNFSFPKYRQEKWFRDREKTADIIKKMKKVGYSFADLGNNEKVVDIPKREEAETESDDDNQDAAHQKELNEKTEVCVYCLREIKLSVLVKHENYLCDKKNDDTIIKGIKLLPRPNEVDDNAAPIDLCMYCLKDVPLSELIDHEAEHARQISVKTSEERSRRLTILTSSEAGETICASCGDSVSFKNLQSHENKHLKTKTSYVCEVCGIFCKHRSLIDHLATHSQERRHVCAVCGKSFKIAKSLARHKLVHSDIGKHKCSVCQKSFKILYNFKVHLRSHLNVKPFTCNLCDKTFTTKQWRDNHMKTH